MIPEKEQQHQVKTEGSGLYKAQKSKFYSFVFSCTSELIAKELVQQVKKKYYDARHICWAYRVGTSALVENLSDDGEPKNSAGAPILNQLRVNQITNTIIVVVRYFGGIKLGVAGLIQAYKTAAAEALNQCELEIVIVTKKISVCFDSSALQAVMQVIGKENFTILSQEFGNQNQIIIEAQEKQVHKVYEAFSDIQYMVEIQEY